MNPNFRGLREVVMVDVLEGNGDNIPYRIVHYIFDFDQHGGSFGDMVGKIDPMDSQKKQQVSNKYNEKA